MKSLLSTCLLPALIAGFPTVVAADPRPAVIERGKAATALIIDVGPKGMTVSKEGVVRWEAPAQLGAGPVRVAITVRDGRGKESLHVFDLAVQ